MLRKKSKAVPEGDGPIPQDAYVILDGITLEELRRVLSEVWDEVCEENGLKKPENPKEMRVAEQRSANLEQDVWQLRLAMEADVTADKKNRERTEGVAAAVQTTHGDSCSAKSAQAGPTSLTNFGKKTEPPALPRRDDVLVENDAAAPKSCLSALEMHTPTAAGNLLTVGKVSTTTRVTFCQPRLWFCPTKETHSERMPIQYASYYSRFWRMNNLLAAPSCQRVIETKSGQTLVFDPGGFTGYLRACPFSKTRRALVCGEIFVKALDEAAAFFGGCMARSHHLE